MARRRLWLLLALIAATTLSGCISYQSEYRHEHPSDDTCWMFCGDSYESTFVIFPMIAFLVIVLVVVLIVVVAVNASQPPNPPPQQQVVVQRDPERPKE